MPLEPGPNEQAVRATLPGRPANIINEASLGAQGCFAGFFNGASSKGIIFVPENDSLTIGKAECEWDWRENWGELKKLGLLEWTEEPKTDARGKPWVYVWPEITAKGREVRKDDVAWFRALMDAMSLDRKEGPNG